MGDGTNFPDRWAGRRRRWMPAGFMLPAFFLLASCMLFAADDLNGRALAPESASMNSPVQFLGYAYLPGAGGSLYESRPIVGNLRYVPPGTFQQGAPAGAFYAINVKNFTHTLTRAMAVMEVEATRAMWYRLRELYPDLPEITFFLSEYSPDEMPANDVTWYEAVLFANLLSRHCGFTPCYYIMEGGQPVEVNSSNYIRNDIHCNWDADGFRLPSEGEWEYFCRAGTAGPFSFNEGNFTKSTMVGCYPSLPMPTLNAHAFWCGNARSAQPKPIRLKWANPWNLFDVHGNIYEHCWDYFLDDYPAEAVQDYSGPVENPLEEPQLYSVHSRRGGSFEKFAVYQTSSSRSWVLNDFFEVGAYRGRDTGFRLVRTVPAQEPPGADLTWEWNFGDGTAVSAAQHPVHNYTRPGIFNWTLTVKSGGQTLVLDGSIQVLSGALAPVLNGLDSLESAALGRLANDARQLARILAIARQQSAGTSAADWWQAVFQSTDDSQISTITLRDRTKLGLAGSAADAGRFASVVGGLTRQAIEAGNRNEMLNLMTRIQQLDPALPLNELAAAIEKLLWNTGNLSGNYPLNYLQRQMAIEQAFDMLREEVYVASPASDFPSNEMNTMLLRMANQLERTLQAPAAVHGFYDADFASPLLKSGFLADQARLAEALPAAGTAPVRAWYWVNTQSREDSSQFHQGSVVELGGQYYASHVAGLAGGLRPGHDGEYVSRLEMAPATLATVLACQAVSAACWENIRLFGGEYGTTGSDGGLLMSTLRATSAAFTKPYKKNDFNAYRGEMTELELQDMVLDPADESGVLDGSITFKNTGSRKCLVSPVLDIYGPAGTGYLWLAMAAIDESPLYLESGESRSVHIRAVLPRNWGSVFPLRLDMHVSFGSNVSYLSRLNVTLQNKSRFYQRSGPASGVTAAVQFAVEMPDSGSYEKTVTPSNKSKYLGFLMLAESDQVDLHIYDQNDQHAGMNYETGQVELNIPGAIYSGAGQLPEFILVPYQTAKYKIRAVEAPAAGAAGAGPPEQSSAGPAEFRPAAKGYHVCVDMMLVPELPVMPWLSHGKLVLGGQWGERTGFSFSLAELGGQQPWQDLTVSVTDLLAPDGTVMVPAASIPLSPAVTRVEAGQRISVKGSVTIPNPLRQPATGMLQIRSAAANFDVPLTLDPITANITRLFERIIPAAAHSTGVGGTAWRSDLDILNLSSFAGKLELGLYRFNQGNPAPATARLTVPPAMAIRQPDVLGEVFDISNAALGVYPAGDLLFADSRFYNTSAKCNGSFGMSVPACGPEKALAGNGHQVGVFHHLGYSLQGDRGFRTNIGFANASPFPVAVRTSLYGDDGQLIGHVGQTLAPYMHLQNTKIHEAVRSPSVEHGHARVEVLTQGGLVHAYAMVIDNISGDPMYMIPDVIEKSAAGGLGKTLAEAEAEALPDLPADTLEFGRFIPVAAHVTGANTRWQTDVDLFNPSSQADSVDIALLKLNQANLTPVIVNVAVPAGQTVRLTDILGTTFQFGNAALGFRQSGGRVLINGRFYNAISTCSGGTFGMSLPSAGDGDALAGGVQMVGIFQQNSFNAQFRTNIGFVNASPLPVQVLIRLYNDDGSRRGFKLHTLQAYEHRQFSSIYADFGPIPVNSGYSTVEVLTPAGKVHAYAMLIDNRTADPIYLQPNRITLRYPVPETPKSLKADIASGTSLQLTWNDMSEWEWGFVIERRTGNGSFTAIFTTPPDQAAYLDRGLTAGTTYTYRVKAINGSGESVYSNTVSNVPNVLPAAPVNLAGTAFSSTQINLTWEDKSDNEEGFILERWSETNQRWEQQARLAKNLTAYSIKNLKASTVYKYRIRAYNSAGDSDFSNEVSVTTPAA